MKTNLDHQERCTSLNAEVPAGFCRRVADSLVSLKEQLTTKYEVALPGRRHLVRELIAEAEALAWETQFPHLFLPDFAELRLAQVLAEEQPAFSGGVSFFRN